MEGATPGGRQDRLAGPHPKLRSHIDPTITSPLLHTLICPGVVEKIEDRDQDIQHITALQDKEQEFLGMREGTGGLGQ